MDGLRQDLQGIDAAELDRRAALARWSDNSLTYILAPRAANDGDQDRWPWPVAAATILAASIVAWWALFEFFSGARAWWLS